MGQKRGLNKETILSAALLITESEGFENLSLQNLAAALEVKPPSLYNHVAGLDDIRVQVAQSALEQMEKSIRDRVVGRSHEKAIREIAAAYRDFARKHPQLYKVLSIIARIDDGELRETAHSLQNTFRRILEPYRLIPRDETHFIRFMRSSLHGFVSLEAMGFFRHGRGVNKDLSFIEMTNMFIDILKSYTNRKHP
ncbi:TetR/AcrR family transcriptional regulator [Leadbettera azotonutricia]|uniref:Transcriptional regulator, TetR family n=1 Tax=Leadbettera azotonutricia (strain ATCC BAA-888 / DSM 13862 / ZAS-9) TaxID=545695 RepID=F5YBF3_LEAAZ|nr:TetR/AcrR family transcriptional regulator [Leadbettera azotonutricia]AEF82059.1 transcriptional regulator, TetR family [Leadbettera azotonutricia ZAS-9]